MDKALLVGINRYSSAPLAGCVNDVQDMAKWLVATRGFEAGNIRLLTDGRATTKAILERLNWLVGGLKNGDRILFHYSGHGAQVATRAGSGEVDGKDEVICPVDFDWTDAHMIRDKDFHQLFSDIPAGVIACWVSDSCHSGDLERDMPPVGQQPRRMVPPEDIAWRMEATSVPVSTMVSGELPNIALISGCRSDQTSADAHFEGRANGALTHFLLDALRSDPSTPMLQLLLDVRQALSAGGYSQVPQLECPATAVSRPFLL